MRKEWPYPFYSWWNWGTCLKWWRQDLNPDLCSMSPSRSPTMGCSCQMWSLIPVSLAMELRGQRALIRAQSLMPCPTELSLLMQQAWWGVQMSSALAAENLSWAPDLQTGCIFITGHREFPGQGINTSSLFMGEGWSLGQAAGGSWVWGLLQAFPAHDNASNPPSPSP